MKHFFSNRVYSLFSYKTFSAEVKFFFWFLASGVIFMALASGVSWGGVNVFPEFAAWADVARDGQISFQDPATLAMVSIVDLHHGIMFWLINTSVVVGGLFTMEIYYFYLNEQENSLLDTSQRLSFTDDHELEFVWTVAPMIATLCISIPSISLLYGMDEDNNRAQVDLSVKVVGNQWYWSYEMDELMPSLTKVPGKAMTVSHFATAVDYLTEKEVYNPAHWTPEYLRERYNSGHGFDYCLAAVKGFADSGVSASEMNELREKFRWAFDAVLTPWNWTKNKFGALKLRLLDTQFLVLPLKNNVLFMVTSNDVIHSFAMPSAGIKIDALPGRINSLVCCFFREALMFGQCSELCGQGHGFMPISFLILPQGYLAYTVADLGECVLSIVGRYKLGYNTGWPATVLWNQGIKR